MRPNSFQRRPARRLACALGGLLLLGGLAACDSVEVNPFVQPGNYFSVYGFLDTAADSQVVRVVALRGRLERPADVMDPLAVINARVTSFDLATGDSVAWTPTRVQFRDGTYGHLFSARLRTLFPGRRFRLDVRRSDGKVSWAETTVPERPRWVRAPPELRSGEWVQTVRLEGVINQPDDLRMVYTVGPPGAFRPPRIAVPYGRSGRVEDGAWTVDVTLTRDLVPIANGLAALVGDAVDLSEQQLYGIEMIVAPLDSAWTPPGGAFDPAVLVQPGLFSNVHQGFGFFGAIGHYAEDWTLDPATAEALGFLRL